MLVNYYIEIPIDLIQNLIMSIMPVLVALGIVTDRSTTTVTESADDAPVILPETPAEPEPVTEPQEVPILPDDTKAVPVEEPTVETVSSLEGAKEAVQTRKVYHDFKQI